MTTNSFELRDKKINISQAINIAAEIISSNSSDRTPEKALEAIAELAPRVYVKLFKETANQIYRDHVQIKETTEIIYNLQDLQNILNNSVSTPQCLVDFRNTYLPSINFLNKADKESLAKTITNLSINQEII